MDHRQEVTETKAAAGTPQRGSLGNSVQRLAYASLGLLSVLSDEVETFYEKCVARGEQKAKEARAATRRRQAPRRSRRKTPGAGQPIAAMLDRSGFATKSGMDALIARVDALAREIDVLAGQQQSR